MFVVKSSGWFESWLCPSLPPPLCLFAPFAVSEPALQEQTVPLITPSSLFIAHGQDVCSHCSADCPTAVLDSKKSKYPFKVFWISLAIKPLIVDLMSYPQAHLCYCSLQSCGLPSINALLSHCYRHSKGMWKDPTLLSGQYGGHTASQCYSTGMAKAVEPRLDRWHPPDKGNTRKWASACCKSVLQCKDPANLHKGVTSFLQVS